MKTRPRFFVIDADDVIVQVSEEYHGSMGRFLGHSLWEYLPRAELLVRPHLERARHAGEEVESTIFYAGGTVELRVVPAGARLTVYTTRRTELNVRTLGTLAESLRSIERELAAREPVRHDRPALGFLQALP
jgi:hypothetical protein